MEMKTLQMQPRSKSAQQGFTIIELVVVILLLVNLADTALPRFIDVTEEAHQAAFDGVVGGLSTGNALIRAEFVAGGSTATTVDSFPGITIDLTTGFPAVTTGAACANVFDNLLQGGHPTVADHGGADTATAGVGALNLSATTADFAAIYDDTALAEGCTYGYLPDIADRADPDASDFKTIFVNAVSGDVTTAVL